VQVGEPHDGQIVCFFDALRKCEEHPPQAVQQQGKACLLAQNVSVVLDVGRGEPPVEHAPAAGALLGEGAELSHQIVANLGFDLTRSF